MKRRLMLAATPLVVALAYPAGAFAITVNENFKPQNEFRLDEWLPIHLGGLDLSINKAVMYLWIAAILTVTTLLYVANRMKARPNRVQTVTEMAYNLVSEQMTKANIADPKIQRRWFAFIGTLFLFIFWSNIIGYLPLPIQTEETVDIFGFQLPAFAIYAATANISVPLALTLVVWVGYHVQGIVKQGPSAYFRSWIPGGVEGAARIPIFGIEVISHFVRIISLSVRLYANMLAGHMLILFMAGGLIILLGSALLGVVTVPVAVAFYLFELLLIATLQAFIFAILAGIYVGGATAAQH